MQPTGSNIHLEWLDISGANVRYNSLARDTCRNWGEVANKCPQAGTGVAIASGYADGTLVVSHVRIWGNEGLGIGSAKGRVLHSEFTDNTRNPDWVGFEGAGVKGVTEFEAAHNFVHDEQGNGLWCDHACADDASSYEWCMVPSQLDREQRQLGPALRILSDCSFGRSLLAAHFPCREQ